MPKPDYTEHELASKTAYQGRLLQVREDAVRLPDRHTATREYVIHPGAVLIIPLIGPQTVLLEYQYRYALRRHFYELPAGKAEPGEAALATAQRELLEETGYEARNWRHLATTYPCVGYSNEKVELYLAQNLAYRGHQREHGEFLDVVPLALAEALEWIRRGEISDTKTIMGLLWLEALLRAP
jgi:ADP-ribose pyrophosphatase